MQDRAIIADSAGHTMIDIEAIRAAERGVENLPNASKPLNKPEVDDSGGRRRARPAEAQ